jgi:polyribonucleotide nucleotidyltransferase
MATTQLSKTIGDQTMTFETGKLALQAGGSVVVTYGETQVIGTCTTSAPREGIDFFPLTVDVEERMYAAGKIPGGFFRREGRPSETAILTARLTDRPLRPTFKDGFRDEVQVVITVLSVDMANPYDIPGINAASIATMAAGLPFEGPIGAVRMGLIGGEWRVNPTFQDLEQATFDVVVAGRRNDRSGIDVLMIEGEAPDETWQLLQDGGASVAPTEEVVADGLEAAKRAIGEIIDFQNEFLGQLDIRQMPFEPKPLYSEQTWQAVEGFAAERVRASIVADKRERDEALSAAKDELREHLSRSWGEEAYADAASEVSPAFKALQKKIMRQRVLDEGVRLDGRGVEDIRPLLSEVGLVPRAHGSSLFQRGETQVLNVTTLGMLRMNQMIDTLDPEESKRYIHHYNFPPFSTG